MSQDAKEYPQPPPHVRILRNGSGYDMRAKRISHAPGTFGPIEPGTHTRITPANASQLANRRWQLAREQADQGVIRAVRECKKLPAGPRDAPEAWGHVVENVAHLSLKQDRTAVEAARFVGHATGMLRDRRARASDGPVAGMRIELSEQAAVAVAGVLAEALARESGEDGE